MRKRTILNLILTTVLVAGLLTPATAQTPPPPPTPVVPPDGGLVVLGSGSQSDGKGIPTLTPSPALSAAAAPRTEPAPDVRYLASSYASDVVLAQPPTPPKFLTLPFDSSSGALPDSGLVDIIGQVQELDMDMVRKEIEKQSSESAN